MVQRWTATERMEPDETGEWMRFEDHEREVSAQAVVDGIVRNQLVEALREVLDGWSALSQGGDMERTRSRIAELRKLLESCEHLETVNNRCVRCGQTLHWSHGMESDAEGFDT